MKVLFLDIDGVCNSQRSLVAFGGYPMCFKSGHMELFDHVSIALVRNIVLAAGAKVVLSSAWRITHSAAETAEAFGMPIIDRTPSSASGVRGREIEKWLEAHPEVERYAIIDDSDDMLPDQLPFFVHTRMSDGVSWADAEKLAHLLCVDIYAAMPGSLRLKGLLPC